MPLTHRISYHKAEKMGYSVDEADDFTVVTRKSVQEGDRVWSIYGVGNPRRYYLAQTWIVDRIERSEQQGFETCASAREGLKFSPEIHLNALPWFRQFRESQGNFGFGLNSISSEFVNEFESIRRRLRP